jgi:hypothetical protein
MDHSDKIASLDSMLLEVDSAAERFANINKSYTEELFRTVGADIKAVEQNFSGEMDMDMARILSLYRSIPKNVKDFGRRHTRISNEIGRTTKQLTDFKNALEIKATIDSEGNEITPAYVDRVFDQEIKVAGQLVEEVDEMIDRLHIAENQYESIQLKADSVLKILGVRE